MLENYIILFFWISYEITEQMQVTFDYLYLVSFYAVSQFGLIYVFSFFSRASKKNFLFTLFTSYVKQIIHFNFN